MNKTVAPVVLFLAFASLAAFGGDIKVVFIANHHDPNWKPGNLLLTDEQLSKLEFELPLKGVTKMPAFLEKCPGIASIYAFLVDSPDYRWLASRIAAMGEDDVYIYLIDDREGLTPIMIDYAGICDYTESQGGKRYAWLCGQADPERAVKIGEHFAQQFLKKLEEPDDYPERLESYKALFGVLAAEMLHTVVGGGWQPNDIILKPGTVFTRKIGDVARRRDSGKSGGFLYELTVMPTDNSCELEGMGIYICLAAADSMLPVYHKFYENQGVFKARKGSETLQMLGKKPDFETIAEGHAGYFWDTVTPGRLFHNEVFYGLFLYFFTETQPPVRGKDNKMHNGFEQVMDHFGETQEAGVALAEVIVELVKYYKKSTSPDDPKLRQLYALGLLDILGRFKAKRVEFEGFFADKMPASEAGDLFDSYFGTPRVEGLRDDLKRKTVGMDLAAMVKHLRDRLKQKVYTGDTGD